MQLDKLIMVNKLFDTIIGGMIIEYDIKSAGATAIRELKGDKIYNDLMKLSKLDRNITIGKMMMREKHLSSKVNDLLLKYMNKFLSLNDIKTSNFVYSTRDSIVLYNKIPHTLKFGNVEFRNKEGSFSSLYRLNGRISLFFDSLSGRVACKGIDQTVVSKSILLNVFLKQPLLSIENNQNRGYSVIFNVLSKLRKNYMTYNDKNIYKSLLNGNKLGVKISDVDMYLDDNVDANDPSITNIIKETNYIDIILPLMRATTYIFSN